MITSIQRCCEEQVGLPTIIMAGRVRQPIDIKSLEAYIDKNVPEIKTPIDLKQV